MADAPDYVAFAELCERLRPLGLVKIEGHGFSAVFDLSHRQQQATPLAAVPNASQRPKKLTEDVARELGYAAELGR